MAPRPGSDFFDASIVVDSGTIQVNIDGAKHEWKADWSDSDDYFKAGVYVQHMPGMCTVDYKSLTWKMHSGYKEEPEQPEDPDMR